MPKELAQLQFEIIILVHIKNQHEKVSLVVRSLWQCQTGINNKKPRPGKQVRLRKSMIAEMPPFAHCTPPCICTLFCRSSYCSRSWLPRHWFLQDLSSYFAIFLHSFTLPETDWRRTSNGPPCRTPGRFDSSRSCWLMCSWLARCQNGSMWNADFYEHSYDTQMMPFFMSSCHIYGESAWKS